MLDNISNFMLLQIIAATCFSLILFFDSYSWSFYSVLPVLLGLVSIDLPGRKQIEINALSKYYTILTYNVLGSNSEYKKLIEYVEEVDPDFVLLIEANQNWKIKILPLEQKFQSMIAEIRNDNFGIVFLSKHPFTSSRIQSFSKKEIPSTIAQMRIDEKELTVIGTHTLPPTSQNFWDDRNFHLTGLKNKLDQSDSPLIVAGDLNVSPWSSYGSILLGSGDYFDIYDAFIPTWPADLYPMSITLDYVLYNKFIEKISYQVGKNLGSDHLPVIMKFKL